MYRNDEYETVTGGARAINSEQFCSPKLTDAYCISYKENETDDESSTILNGNKCLTQLNFNNTYVESDPVYKPL